MIRTRHSAKILITILSVFLVSTEILFSQGICIDYAGPDRSICAGSSTPIGTTAASGACYAWSSEPPGFTSELSNPVVSPTVTTTYTVRVVGPNFSYTAIDQVVVSIYNHVDDIDVTSKICCWKVGDAITADQFEINTVPAGAETQIKTVTITPNIAPPVPFGANTDIDIQFDILFECNGEQQLKTKTISITIVNESFEVSYSNSVELENFKSIEKILKNLMKPFKFLSTCDPGVSFNLEGSTTVFQLCCTPEQGCLVLGNELAGTASASASITCDFPLPPFPVVNIVVEAEVGLNGTISIRTQCVESKFCIELQGYGSLGGGLSVGNSNVIRAALVLIGTLNLPPITFCTPPNEFKVPGDFCVDLDVEGSITMYSFYEQKVTFSLIEDACLTLW
jgi:hypothetical protein